MEWQKSKYLYHPKVRNVDQLGHVLDVARKQKSDIKVGFANGKYLVPHVGHSVFLSLCKNECSILVAAINSDFSLKHMGFEQPKFSDRERAFHLACFESVDYVILFDEETPALSISKINPDYIFKGPDYEKEDVVSIGKEVKIISHPFEIHSSDLLAKKYKYFEVG